MTTPDSSVCGACGTALALQARFCSHCGFALAAVAPVPRGTSWYYNTWFVLFMLFLVLGPFGLPLAWKHPRWPRSVKLALTVIVLGYTVWLLQVSLHTAQTVLQHFQQLETPYRF